MEEGRKIIYRSKKDIPVMNVLMLFVAAFMLLFPVYLMVFINFSAMTIFISIFMVLLGVLCIYEGLTETTQNVIVTKGQILIIPNQFGNRKNERPIEIIQRDELLSIRTDGTTLKFMLKDRIMDQYQKQDEVHMRTSSWGKARRLRDEIVDIIKSE